ncbi:acyl-CoA thioester hydrolase/BAAT C-terminal domain-containing protein [Alicyclobacillus fodiniaquatilis]|uniref:Acyl-CoA thioester hydrolase/BAAT C-terminal domain-containing protein n=1 Tax=Alicyclobacillus fodiniaquatilis TaxID=1661150 RepID=A0ABW4JMH5_9BACL
MENLPAELVKIPLEYIKTAIDWFRDQSVVQRKPGIGIYGGSRGGELALLVASTYSEIKAVVSVCGSGLIMGGYHKIRDFRFPAWTYEGTPLPNVRRDNSPLAYGPISTDWEAFRTYHSDNLKQATIPVERIQGAVLMFSGQKDRIWNSFELTNVAMTRFQEKQFPYPYEHIVYPDAGHRIYIPYTPEPIDHDRFGGTLQANADASVDHWKRTVDFFSNHLDH